MAKNIIIGILIFIIIVLSLLLLFGNRILTKNILKSVLPDTVKNKECVVDILSKNLNGDEMAIASGIICGGDFFKGDKPQICKEVSSDITSAALLAKTTCKVV